MSDQTADMLERALRRNHSGNWPLVMPSDLLALVEDFRRKSERIAALERDRALLLRFAKAEQRVRVTNPQQGTGPYVVAVQERDDACRALIGAGLLEGDEAARQEQDR